MNQKKKTPDDIIRDYVLGKLDEETQRLARLAWWDLMYGPMGPTGDDGAPWPGFSVAVDLVGAALDVRTLWIPDYAAGAEDVVSSENGHEVYTTNDSLRDVAKALEAKFGEPRKAALTWKPQNTVPVDDEQGEKVLKLINALNDQDDVQNVYANFEVSDALIAKMSA